MTSAAGYNLGPRLSPAAPPGSVAIMRAVRTPAAQVPHDKEPEPPGQPSTVAGATARWYMKK
jgi:hypothetical protein